MILVDTSVWVDHLRRAETELAELLDTWQVVMHPFVLGELACGNLQARRELLQLWRDLPGITTALEGEALSLIERRRLMGRGIGYIDVHLLASVLLTPECKLWTRDKRLAEIATELGAAYAANQ
ncbi:MAG: type II toxin-antitoxin system VapC family toxin [Pseudomonadota bacterium]